MYQTYKDINDKTPYLRYFSFIKKKNLTLIVRHIKKYIKHVIQISVFKPI